MAAKSDFGPATTTDEVLGGIDLSGHLALVTGASAGIGVETARALAAHGASIVMPVRDTTKGEQAAAQIRESVPSAKLDIREMDLASLKSVRAFTDSFLNDYGKLDLLIANAGVMGCPFGHTQDGFEMQFGTNHLGHFVLVNRLLPTVLAAAPTRIVILSSFSHRWSDVNLDDPHYETTPYDKFLSYGRAKTANILFAVELDKRLKDRGVRAFAVHPGSIGTELGRHYSENDREDMMKIAMESTAGQGGPRKSIPAGAATSVWGAVGSELKGKGGLYLEDCGIAETREAPGIGGVMPYALDPGHALALWKRSEELVGEKFDF